MKSHLRVLAVVGAAWFSLASGAQTAPAPVPAAAAATVAAKAPPTVEEQLATLQKKMQDWAQLAARAVFGGVFRIVADSPLIGHPVHNLIVSNVPGPQAQLYFLGCEVEAMYPLGPLFHGCGLNLTAMSLNGTPKRRRHLVSGLAARPVATGRRIRCCATDRRSGFRASLIYARTWV